MVQVKKAEVRESILEAAYNLFLTKGYVGTSVSEIGRMAGVAPSGIYVYFKSKLALFYALYEPWMKERLDGLDAEVQTLADRRMRVRRIVEVIWLDIPEDYSFFASNLMQAVSTTPRGELDSTHLLDWCEDRLAATIETALDRRGVDRDACRNVAHIILMGFDGFAVRSYMGVNMEKMEAIIETMTDLVLSLAPQPTPALSN
ncbi:TetR/AcrR family transcriptional regulator [Acuticoccus mangrovi]|uniref:TetR/AcrR family transcriptional regulator n=1 Tax=Acuticoccus mangrovi TaxID=2796142 RepID=A0A934IJQ5_9HYPH|nr:TetR/AcrR family transcriptional regulator [Acuticoccus mangrovi]MBJ3775022.1 TetR/AcrR family transcriptional regulator [Acuticoccus mangrovi]